jgi:hypothetical protein
MACANESHTEGWCYRTVCLAINQRGTQRQKAVNVPYLLYKATANKEFKVVWQFESIHFLNHLQHIRTLASPVRQREKLRIFGAFLIPPLNDPYQTCRTDHVSAIQLTKVIRACSVPSTAGITHEALDKKYGQPAL